MSLADMSLLTIELVHQAAAATKRIYTQFTSPDTGTVVLSRKLLLSFVLVLPCHPLRLLELKATVQCDFFTLRSSHQCHGR